MNKEQLLLHLNSRAFTTGLAVGISLVAGGVAGSVIATKKLEAKYAKLAEVEIAQAKAFYSRINKEDFPTPQEAAESLLLAGAVEALTTYQGEDVAAVVTDEVQDLDNEFLDKVEPPEGMSVVTKNVFTDAKVDDDGFDPTAEERNPEVPYIISHDEFMEAEPGFDQQSLTYFAGDDVLSDERDAMIAEVQMTVGNENLQRFGVGSGDANVVYIRNERIELDFMVARSEGKYAQEVLGFDDEKEFKHSHRPRKFREYDE